MYWELPEGETLFTKSKMKPMMDENIEAEKIKLSITDRFPARIQLALVHQAANKFGITKIDQDETCACCDERIGIEELPARVTLEKVNCPTGFVLTFSFIRMTMFYMLLHASIAGLYNIYSNLQGQQCQNIQYPQLEECHSSNIFLRLSPANKLFDDSQFQRCSIFNLIFVIAAIVFFIVYRKIHYESNILASYKTQTQNQYAVFISNIPKITSNGLAIDQESLREYFQKIIDQWIKLNKQQQIQSYRYIDYTKADSIPDNHPKNRVSQKGDVTYVHLCWDLSEIYQAIRNKGKIKDEIQSMAQAIVDGQYHRPSFEVAMTKYKQNMPTLKQQLSNIDNQLLQLGRQYSMKQNRSSQFYITHFVGKAFIVFQYQHFAHVVRQHISRGNSYIGHNKLQAQWASHPRDIYWQNLTTSQKIRVRRQFTSVVILLGTVFFSFCVCMCIQYAGTLFKPKQRVTIFGFGLFQITITQSVNLVIYLVNLVLFAVMTSLTKYESHQTRTYEQNSLLWKSLVAQFLNSAIILIIMHKILKVSIWDEQGLILNGTSQALMSIVYDILIKMVNYSYLSTRLKLWWKYGSGPMEQPKFQSRLNQEFQWPEFDLADSYINYICQIYIALFFTYFCPIGTFVTAIGFAIQYMLDKRMLVRQSSVKSDYNYLLSRQALKLLQKSIVVFALGNLLFQWMFFKISAYTVIAVIIASIFAFTTFFVRFEQQKNLLSNIQGYQDISYTTAFNKGNFEHTYRNKDPSTRFTSRKIFGKMKNYCTLQDAQKWLMQKHVDQTIPYPPYDPNTKVKSFIP